LKHVFVETNFIIELVRPLPGPDAEKLFARQGADVRLHLPWASVVEAKRTLDRIIREDLGFDDSMQRFGVRRFRAGSLSQDEKKVLDHFATIAKAARETALKSIGSDVDAKVAKMELIEPTKGVITKTLSIYPIKSLPPFDEMIMGAVLTKAYDLLQSGETDLYFCNLNKKDFDPTNRSQLEAEYKACGLKYLPTFKVP
jgi:hypothetical protein